MRNSNIGIVFSFRVFIHHDNIQMSKSSQYHEINSRMIRFLISAVDSNINKIYDKLEKKWILKSIKKAYQNRILILVYIFDRDLTQWLMNFFTSSVLSRSFDLKLIYIYIYI